MPRGGGSRGGGGGRSMGGRSGSGRTNMGGSRGGSGGLGRSSSPIGRAPARNVPSRRAPARNNNSFGGGFTRGVGMGMGMEAGRRMMGGGRRRRGFGGGFHGGHGHGQGRNHGQRGRNSGSGVIILLIIIAIILIPVIWNTQGGGGIGRSQVQRSTTQRTALPSNAAHDTVPLITDHIGWISNQTQVTNALRNFHSRTGVRPHLYITNNLNGDFAVPTPLQLGAYANELYEEMFTDEAHLLFIFFENAQGTYTMYALPGSQARSVLDMEARDILMDYIERHYHNANLTTDAFFANSFNDASQRIMRVDRNPWIPVLIILGIIVILFILLVWWQKRKAQQNLEHEQTMEVLNTSFEPMTGGIDDEASRLADRYTEDDEN